MVWTAGVSGRISNICVILMHRKDKKCKYNFQVPQINSAPQGLSLFTWTWFLAHCIVQILPESYTKYYVCLLYLSFMPYFLVCLQVHPHSSCKSSKCSPATHSSTSIPLVSSEVRRFWGNHVNTVPESNVGWANVGQHGDTSTDVGPTLAHSTLLSRVAADVLAIYKEPGH